MADCSSPTNILDLHEALLLNIFCFLPVIDAIRASLVCRPWRHIWHRMPQLSFDYVQFSSPSIPYSVTRDFFVEFVTQALSIRQHTTPLQKFHLRYGCQGEDDEETIDSWVRAAITFQPVEIDLDFEIRVPSIMDYVVDQFVDIDMMNESVYLFDFSLIAESSTVKVIKLRRCSFLRVPEGTRIASLTSLTLCDVWLQDVNKRLTRLVKSCVNMEQLKILCCIGLRHIIVSSPKLKEFIHEGDYLKGHGRKCSIIMNSPCLHSVFLTDVKVGKVVFEGSSQLTKAEVTYYRRTSTKGQVTYKRSLKDYRWWCNVLSSLTSFKYLIVQNMFISKKFLEPGKKLKGINFKGVSHLELRTGYSESEVAGICIFLNHSPALESLVIDYFYPKDSDDSTITEEFTRSMVALRIPHLRKAELKNYRGTKGEKYVEKLLRMHGVVLEKSVTTESQAWVKNNPLSVKSSDSQAGDERVAKKRIKTHN